MKILDEKELNTEHGVITKIDHRSYIMLPKEAHTWPSRATGGGVCWTKMEVL